MKKQLVVILVFTLAWVCGKAQSATGPAPFIVYKMKITGINSPGELKDISNDLHALFDTYNQSYSIADSTIIVKSTFDQTENLFKNKLANYGYNVTSFSKILSSSAVAPR